jgi:hypothetical protein
MVGMSFESLPVVASAVGGILILAMLVAGVVYGWWLDEKKSRQTAAGQLLKRAA